MSTKRKRVVLSMAEKLEIIKLLKDGLSAKDIAHSYGVGVTTVFGIKKQSESIESFVSVLETEEGSSCRKTMRKARNTEVEDAVYQWYLEQKSLGEHITDPILCEKALWFNQELGGGEFKASNGWLRNFKSRHGIRNLELPCENPALSPHRENIEKFVTEFASLVESESYDPDLIYNIKATYLSWKSLPKVLDSKVNPSASSNETEKDLLTVLLCCNSTGKHKLNLHLVGKVKCPKALSSARLSPVTYAKDKTALINETLFVEWYDTVFIPEVKKYQERTEKLGKILLLLSNAPFFPSSELLEREEGSFKVKFLPDNITPLLEPMCRGISKTLKHVYRKQVLRRFLLGDMEKDGALGVCKSLNLKNCAYILADAWNSLNEEMLQKAWGRIFGQVVKVGEDANGAELLGILRSIPGCSRSGAEEVVEWIKSDEVQRMDQETAEPIEAENNVDEQEEDDDEEEEGVVVPSHDDVFRMLQKLILWCERQSECNVADIDMLRRLRDLAAVKRLPPERNILLNSLKLS